ncbi:MAG: hypothetical protein Q9227_005563 [Pyrenula ochraceoflavens]
MTDINMLFAPTSVEGLPPDVLGELESMLRLHSISPTELFFKWESYSLKMGSEETVLDLETVRMFKKDVQDSVERESRNKHQTKVAEKRGVTSATPRTVTNGNVFGMSVISLLKLHLPLIAVRLDGLVSNTPVPRSRVSANGSNEKRKGVFDTPSTAKVSRHDANGISTVDGLHGTPFPERLNPGQILESLNEHLSVAEAPVVPFAEPRVKPALNTDYKKFSYRPMGMRQSEASEVLDERIDEYMLLIQKAHRLEDSTFGNPAAQSTSEIVAVGRIACDTPESKLSASSIMLETSRRMGAGIRVPLRVNSLPSYQLFPGQIIAVKGTNVTGDSFTVSEILNAPLAPLASSKPEVLEGINARLGVTEDDSSSQPLNLLLASGPYTADDNLDFEPLKAICQKAEETAADTLILIGPFLDTEHPLLLSGDFDLPDLKSVDPSTTTMTTLFRLWISSHLQALASAIPNIVILLIPSVRDFLNRHVSWPQDLFKSKQDLGLPKQARLLTNPVTMSLNETICGISAHDTLYELRQEELVGGITADLLARLPRHLIEQRHFFPLFPPNNREKLLKPGGEQEKLATGASLDLSYMKLGEFISARPDVLVTPSALPPFVKVVESVLVINPGTLSKRKAAGTYAQIALQPRLLSEEEQTKPSVAHKVFQRARVDIVRI